MLYLICVLSNVIFVVNRLHDIEVALVETEWIVRVWESLTTDTHRCRYFSLPLLHPLKDLAEAVMGEGGHLLDDSLLLLDTARLSG